MTLTKDYSDTKKSTYLRGEDYAVGKWQYIRPELSQAISGRCCWGEGMGGYLRPPLKGFMIGGHGCVNDRPDQVDETALNIWRNQWGQTRGPKKGARETATLLVRRNALHQRRWRQV